MLSYEIKVSALPAAESILACGATKTALTITMHSPPSLASAQTKVVN